MNANERKYNLIFSNKNKLIRVYSRLFADFLVYGSLLLALVINLQAPSPEFQAP